MKLVFRLSEELKRDRTLGATEALDALTDACATERNHSTYKQLRETQYMLARLRGPQ